MQVLRTPRGHYSAERAAQLAGIPKTTLYDWQRNNIYVPDYATSSPMGWSYRDLVFVRVVAWLRQQRMARPRAAECVHHLRTEITRGANVEVLRAGPHTFQMDESQPPVKGLQHSLMADWLAAFELTDVVEEFGRERLWGPDLVNPSRHTHISPWVLAGEPCVASTRVQTSSIFVLRTERGLSTQDVTDLYPGLDSDEVEDAFLLEMRLRGAETAA